MDIGGWPLGLTTLPGDADRIPLGDHCSLRNRDLTEMGQGNRVPVELDRHGTARGRHDTGERHRSRRRSPHRLSARPGDIETTMLTGRIRIGTERVGTKYIPSERPRPGRRRWGQAKRCEYHQPERETTHVPPPVTNLDNDEDETVLVHFSVVKSAYKELL